MSKKTPIASTDSARLRSRFVICALLGFSVGCGPGQDAPTGAPAGAKSPYKPKYDTIAHRAMKIESELGIEPNYRLLDEIIDEAEERIEIRDSYSSEAAAQILQTIDDVLVKKNFVNYRHAGPLPYALQSWPLDADVIESIKRYNPAGDGQWTLWSNRNEEFTPSLKQKEHILAHPDEKHHYGCCSILSVLYLAVGEALDLPLQGVQVPEHVFVRWYFSDGSYYNWETTAGWFMEDEDYVSRFKIPATSKTPNPNFKTLSEAEVLALAYERRAYRWKKRKEWDKAVADFDKAIALSPDYALLYNLRGNAYQESGDPDRAITDYTKAIAVNANFAAAYMNRGIACHAKGDYDRAIAEYEKAISIAPEYAKIYCNRAVAYTSKGDDARALADYDKAVALNPADAVAYSNRGTLFCRMGKYDRAIADLDKAIDLDSNNANAYSARCNAYLSKGDTDRALADLNEAIRLDPNDVWAYDSRARIYIEKGDCDRAIADYDKVLGLEPTQATAYCNRGSAYYYKGEFDRAIADYTKAIGLDPDNAYAYVGRGSTYEWKGDQDAAIVDYDKAIVYLDEAISVEPDYAWAYEYRARAWCGKGDYVRAWADVKRCREAGGRPDADFVKYLEEVSGKKE